MYRILSMFVFMFLMPVFTYAHTHTPNGKTAWEKDFRALKSLTPHKMQHGFIISNNDLFFDHLVTNGHHSYQLNFSGLLEIENELENSNYQELKSIKNYFLFQAQNIHLPSLFEGQILQGHIIQSKIGDYQPGNIVVKNAKITIKKIYTNLPNPFFN